MWNTSQSLSTQLLCSAILGRIMMQVDLRKNPANVEYDDSETKTLVDQDYCEHFWYMTAIILILVILFTEKYFD